MRRVPQHAVTGTTGGGRDPPTAAEAPAFLQGVGSPSLGFLPSPAFPLHASPLDARRRSEIGVVDLARHRDRVLHVPSLGSLHVPQRRRARRLVEAEPRPAAIRRSRVVHAQPELVAVGRGGRDVVQALGPEELPAQHHLPCGQLAPAPIGDVRGRGVVRFPAFGRAAGPGRRHGDGRGHAHDNAGYGCRSDTRSPRSGDGTRVGSWKGCSTTPPSPLVTPPLPTRSTPRPWASSSSRSRSRPRPRGDGPSTSSTTPAAASSWPSGICTTTPSPTRGRPPSRPG